MQATVLEEEKRTLAQTLFRRVTNGRDKIHYREVVGRGFAEFFDAAVKLRAKKIVKSESPIQIHLNNRFAAANSSKLKARISQLRHLLAQEVSFEPEEIRALAEYAVGLQFDAIVRPRQTLTKVLFADGSARKKSDILVVVEGFGMKRPFIHKTFTTLRGVEFETLNQEKFGVICQSLERQVYEERPVSAFLTDLRFLMRLYASVTGKPTRGVSSTVVLAMLRARNLANIAEEFRKEAASTGGTWTPEGIETALQRYLLVGVSEELDEISEPDIAKREPLNPPKVSEQKKEKVSRDTEKDAIKITFAEERQTPRLARSSIAARPAYSDDDELIINRRDIESQPPGPYPALYTLINPKDRKVFIRKIFRKDSQKYLEFIKKLEKLDRWKDAKAVIDEELRTRQISPYSKEAVLLGDVVFSRYFQK